MYRTADVGDYGSIDKAIESIVDELGTIDVLINNVCITNLVLALLHLENRTDNHRLD